MFSRGLLAFLVLTACTVAVVRSEEDANLSVSDSGSESDVPAKEATEYRFVFLLFEIPIRATFYEGFR